MGLTKSHPVREALVMKLCSILVMGLALLIAAGCESVQAGDAKTMSESEKMQNLHQHFSASCFNECWGLIDKADRSPEDTENMILLSAASLWHWKQRDDCTPQNLSIGYWQLSRAYALAEQYDMAQLVGEACVKVSLDGKLAPFFLGYAYEALARAAIGQGDFATAAAHLDKAETELLGVADEEEKELLQADLTALREMMPN